MSEAECGCRKNVKKESEVNILSSIPEKIVTGVIDNVVGFMRKKYGENQQKYWYFFVVNINSKLLTILFA